MPKNKKQKEDIVGVISRELKDAKGAVIANFHGLTMKDSDELRTACKEKGVRYIVTKKTLLRKALSLAGFDVDTKSFDGGVSVLASATDEVAPASTLFAFAKTHERAYAYRGILDGTLIDAAKIVDLAKLPSKQQLLAQLVGTLNAPVSGFVNVLAGNLRGLVTVLSAVKDKKTA